MGLLKLGLISLGLILGIYLKSYLAGLVWLWWAIFAVTAAYFIGKLVQEKDMSTQSPQIGKDENAQSTPGQPASSPQAGSANSPQAGSASSPQAVEQKSISSQNIN